MNVFRSRYAKSSRKRAATLAMLTGGIGLAVMFPVVAPLVGSAQTAGTTGILALVGSGVGVGAANGVQGSVAARQQKAEASAATEKIKVHCPISDCAHKQRIEVPVSINLHGRSWSCVECGQPFELRQCNNCFELGAAAPFLATGGAANELESGLQAADRARLLTCQRKGGACGGAMIGEVTVQSPTR